MTAAPWGVSTGEAAVHGADINFLDVTILSLVSAVIVLTPGKCGRLVRQSATFPCAPRDLPHFLFHEFILTVS